LANVGSILELDVLAGHIEAVAKQELPQWARAVC
jgi:hypothetical protein